MPKCKCCNTDIVFPSIKKGYCDACADHSTAQADRITELEAENKALRDYVEHSEVCQNGKYFGKHGCTCGLDELLTPPTGGK